MRSKIQSPLQMTMLISIALLLFSCSDHSQPNVELIQDFMVTPALKAQRLDESAPNQIGSRLPPENTVPVGFTPYVYGTDAARAAKENKNPMAGNMSIETLMVGQKNYETNCMICHGMKGQGGEQSSVGQLMALKPPSLLSDKIRGWNDAQIYHVITAGQGVMGPYASHVQQSSRWQVVNYIRHLQQKAK